MIKKFIDEKTQCSSKILVCKELKNKEAKLTFYCNKEKFYKILIDTKNTKKIANKITRCDYVIATTDLKEIIIYIELKGGDLKKAIKQILATHTLLNDNFKKRYSAISYTGNPQAKTIIQNSTKQFKDKKIQLPFTSSGAIKLKYNSDTQIISIK